MVVLLVLVNFVHLKVLVPLVMIFLMLRQLGLFHSGHWLQCMCILSWQRICHQRFHQLCHRDLRCIYLHLHLQLLQLVVVLLVVVLLLVVVQLVQACPSLVLLNFVHLKVLVPLVMIFLMLRQLGLFHSGHWLQCMCILSWQRICHQRFHQLCHRDLRCIYLLLHLLHLQLLLLVVVLIMLRRLALFHSGHRLQCMCILSWPSISLLKFHQLCHRDLRCIYLLLHLQLLQLVVILIIGCWRTLI